MTETKKRKPKITTSPPRNKRIVIRDDNTSTATELARAMGVQPGQVIKCLISSPPPFIATTLNNTIEADAVLKAATHFGFTVPQLTKDKA